MQRFEGQQGFGVTKECLAAPPVTFVPPKVLVHFILGSGTTTSTRGDCAVMSRKRKSCSLDRKGYSRFCSDMADASKHTTSDTKGSKSAKDKEPPHSSCLPTSAVGSSPLASPTDSPSDVVTMITATDIPQSFFRLFQRHAHNF